MKYNYKHNSKKSRYRLLIFLVVLVGVIALCGAAAFKFYTDNFTSSPQKSSELAVKTSGTPQFSFDAAAAPGWYRGPIDKVSMALFSKDRESGCWTSIEIRSGSVDPTTEVQKIQNSLTSGGNTVVATGTVLLALRTGSGPVQYELHQFSVTGESAAAKPYGAQEFGYFPLGNGYGKVQGYCNTTDKLPTITPALQAIKFDAAK